MDKSVNCKDETNSKKRRGKATEYRDREYLFKDEMNRLLASAKKEQYGKLWHCYLLVMYRHAFRVSELINLKWSDIDFVSGQIKVNRLKGSVSGVHPLGADEIKALKLLYRNKKSNYVFISSQGKPLSNFTVNKAVSRIGIKTNLDFPIHPHMIRHSAAIHFLESAKDLFLTQQFLGHKEIANTLIYLKLTPGRLENVGEWHR